jgi:hypothetical protein
LKKQLVSGVLVSCKLEELRVRDGLQEIVIVVLEKAKELE